MIKKKTVIKILLITFAITAYLWWNPPLGSLDIESLQGPDEDKNGVRDDIDEYVEENYVDINLKKAIRQQARYARIAFTYLDDPDTLAKAFNQVMLSSNCIMAVIDEKHKLLYLEGNSLNTKLELYGDEIRVFNKDYWKNNVKTTDTEIILRDKIRKMYSVWREANPRHAIVKKERLQIRDDMTKKMDEVLTLIFNTRKRKKAEKQMLKSLVGNVFASPFDIKTVCDFEYQENQ